jgi:broad specificity phosphatase PhoE
MQITFIRHLPTDWNNKTWLQGRKDIEISPLTKDFEKQIAVNQQILKKLSPFNVVLASTLMRTHQTAALYGYQSETECLLDELDFGPFEGQPKKKLMETYGDKWIENPQELILGESLLNLENRIVLFLEKYKEYDNVLVFGHGAWIRAMLSYHDYGDINHMNKVTVANNQCVTLLIDSTKKTEE